MDLGSAGRAAHWADLGAWGDWFGGGNGELWARRKRQAEEEAGQNAGALHCILFHQGTFHGLTYSNRTFEGLSTLGRVWEVDSRIRTRSLPTLVHVGARAWQKPLGRTQQRYQTSYEEKRSDMTLTAF